MDAPRETVGGRRPKGFDDVHVRALRVTILRAFRGRRAAISAYLGSVSILALLASGSTAGAANLKSLGSISPTQAVSAAQMAAAVQAAAAGQQSQQSLARAAAALQAARAAQQSAQSLASTLSGGPPDGIATGGLMPAGGIASDPALGIKQDPTLWQDASLPTQTVVNGRTLVDIQQTSQKSILNWTTFNVGRNTTLNFDQNSSDWTVLNRVSDPSAAPSTILGQITARGGVYIINQNGIIFGGGSQINVHALIASDLDVGTLGRQSRSARDAFFMNTGIANPNPLSFSIGGGDVKTTQVGGGVVVQAGAVIQTDDPGPQNPGGFAYLFGANVANYGTINVPNGEVALVSARTIAFTPNSDAAASFPTAVLPAGVQWRGTGFQLQQYASGYEFCSVRSPLADTCREPAPSPATD